MASGGAAAGGLLSEAFATRRLAARFADLEGQRSRFTARIEELPPEDQAWVPVLGAWSALHVMEHLVIAEEWIVAGFDKAPTAGRRVTLHSVVKLQLIYLIFALRLRVRVPSARLVPTGAIPFATLATRWEIARAAIRSRLAPMAASELHRPRFRHPVAGWLTLDQGLQFTARHIRHHRRQVDRIRRVLGR